MNNSNAYIELLKAFPPRPVTAESELIATQETIDSLLDKGELTPDERDYLNVLGTLVYEYEQTLEPIPDIYGIELLKALIEEFKLRQKDLVPIFKTESIISDILREKRQLTTEHIQKLAEFFCVSPAAFFPLHPASKDSQRIELASTQT
ncbi:MAG: transcriptional regulator [Microcoleus sp. CAN_BIN18]|nr:transcriptional regulator [Microcoleus sp. CAN_BIN18]